MASSKSRASIGSIVMIVRAVRSRRSAGTCSVKLAASARAASRTSSENGPGRPNSWMIERVSTPGSPAFPRTSMITPSPSRRWVGKRTTSTTTLSSSRTDFAPGSPTDTGRGNDVPSICTQPELAATKKLPTNRVFARVITSTISPDGPGRRKSRPRDSRTRTVSPLTASRQADWATWTSPSRLPAAAVSGWTNP